MLYFETWTQVQTLNLKKTYESNLNYLLSLSTFRGLNRCWSKAKSRLSLSSNGEHSPLAVFLSESCLFCAVLSMMYPGPGQTCMSVSCHHCIPMSSPGSLGQMWLTKPNEERFIISVVCKGVLFRKQTRKRKSVPFR